MNPSKTILNHVIYTTPGECFAIFPSGTEILSATMLGEADGRPEGYQINILATTPYREGEADYNSKSRIRIYVRLSSGEIPENATFIGTVGTGEETRHIFCMKYGISEANIMVRGTAL